MSLRWKLSTISGRSDFRKVSWFSFYFKSQIWTGRTEIRVHIFIFFKTQIWPSRFLERCSHFRFWWKSKCEHLSCPNLYRKGVHISIFIKNANVNTFSKIWTARFVIWRNWKCEHLSKNLDGQICVLNENENQDTFRKSERPEIVENFHLCMQFRFFFNYPPVKGDGRITATYL